MQNTNEMEHLDPEEDTYWYVLRDLKRPNAKNPAYLELQNDEYQLQGQIFVPLHQKICTRRGKKIVKAVPYLNDLLFVHASRTQLDPIIQSIPTLQYRYAKGGRANDPMKVPHAEMDRFIQAVQQLDQVEYVAPESVSPMLYGKHIRLIGGPLNGFEGRLLTTRGSKKKKLILDLNGFLSAVTEVQPEFIEIIRAE